MNSLEELIEIIMKEYNQDEQEREDCRKGLRSILERNITKENIREIVKF